jgi:hypothetical protein
MELKSLWRGWLGVFLMMKDPATAAVYMFIMLLR